MGIRLMGGVEILWADAEAAVQGPSGASLAIVGANGIRR